MKRSEPLSLAQIIDRAISAADVDKAVAEHRACYLWPEIVGQGINRYTTRRFVESGVLHVYLSSAPLKNELSFHRARLVEMINKAVGSDVISSRVLH